MRVCRVIKKYRVAQNPVHRFAFEETIKKYMKNHVLLDNYEQKLTITFKMMLSVSALHLSSTELQIW